MTASELQERRKIIEMLVAECLEDLIHDGFTSLEQINSRRWHIYFDTTRRLENEKFLAAATIDDHDRPCLVFDPNHPLKAIAWAIPHEVIHLAQICKGDLRPGYGYSFWKGEKFDKISADNPGYTEKQPWEAEASMLEDTLRSRMYARHPLLE